MRKRIIRAVIALVFAATATIAVTQAPAAASGTVSVVNLTSTSGGYGGQWCDDPGGFTSCTVLFNQASSPTWSYNFIATYWCSTAGNAWADDGHGYTFPGNSWSHWGTSNQKAWAQGGGLIHTASIVFTVHIPCTATYMSISVWEVTSTSGHCCSQVWVDDHASNVLNPSIVVPAGNTTYNPEAVMLMASDEGGSWKAVGDECGSAGYGAGGFWTDSEARTFMQMTTSSVTCPFHETGPAVYQSVLLGVVFTGN